MRQSITQHLFYIHWYIRQGDMFRPSRSFSDPPRKQIQELLDFLHCGIPNAHEFQLQKQKYISLYKLNLLCDGYKLKLGTYLIW